MQEGFTGGIKLGFEYGRPVNCSEYSSPEFSPPPVPSDFNPQEVLKKAFLSDYYGSLYFVFEAGAITHFSYIQTWAGQSIKTLLEKSSTPMKGKVSARVS